MEGIGRPPRATCERDTQRAHRVVRVHAAVSIRAHAEIPHAQSREARHAAHGRGGERLLRGAQHSGSTRRLVCVRVVARERARVPHTAAQHNRGKCVAPLKSLRR